MQILEKVSRDKAVEVATGQLIDTGVSLHVEF